MQLAGQLQLDQVTAAPRRPELTLDLDRHLAFARPVQLDREDRLPAAQNQPAVFDQGGVRWAQEELPAVRVGRSFRVPERAVRGARRPD